MLGQKGYSQHWKSILSQGISLNALWNSIEAHAILAPFEIAALAGHLKTAFLVPEPPMPVLRREAKGFDTILQNSLAYSTQEDQGFGAAVDPEVDQVMDTLDLNAYLLCHQFEGRQDYIDLIRTRWSISKAVLRATIGEETACSSIATSCESNSAYTSRIYPLVLQILGVLRKTVKFQCDFHLSELQEMQSGGELLSEYVRRVNNT